MCNVGAVNKSSKMNRASGILFLVLATLLSGCASASSSAGNVQDGSACSDEDFLTTVESDGYEYICLADEEGGGGLKWFIQRNKKVEVPRSNTTTTTNQTPSVQYATVPSLIGLPYMQADFALLRAGLKGSKRQGNSGGAQCAMANAGIVLDQSPLPGSVIPQGSFVVYLTSC
jgi:hypothetical protein